MCPHTPSIYVSSYSFYIYVLILLLYMCPHTPSIHMSSYSFNICVLILLQYMCPDTRRPPALARRGSSLRASSAGVRRLCARPLRRAARAPLQQQRLLRQYLYLRTSTGSTRRSVRVSICTCILVHARQYLYLHTSTRVSICTCILVHAGACAKRWSGCASALVKPVTCVLSQASSLRT